MELCGPLCGPASLPAWLWWYKQTRPQVQGFFFLPAQVRQGCVKSSFEKQQAGFHRKSHASEPNPTPQVGKQINEDVAVIIRN